MTKPFRLFLACTATIVALAQLQGCAVALGGAAGASVAHDHRTAGTMVEDQSIELKALKAILGNKEIADQSHINVTSVNRIVLISGETPTPELRSQIENMIRNIREVRHVHNEVVVAAPSSLLSRSSDTLITAKVKTKFITDDTVDGLRIKVVTENGTVFLMGLASAAQAERAASVASRVGGTQKVVKLFETNN